MSSLLLAVVLLGACMHASWNAIVKAAGDKRYSTTMVAVAAGILGALVLPLLKIPALASWPYFGVSALLQLGYYALLAIAYERGDMSHAYPLMRGCAPLMVAVCSGALLGEGVTAVHWLGISLICGGALALALHWRGEHREGGRAVTRLAVANSCVIAAYTLIDGQGARLSGSPVAYTLWVFILTAVGQLVWAAAREVRPFVSYFRTHWKIGFAGGVGSLVSYSAALWAMTLAPVALVAALRETSIVFGTLISVVVLRERVTARRLVATGFIAAGALALRLA
jgi:drug/metabolite transporter (DMT)-like permease